MMMVFGGVGIVDDSFAAAVDGYDKSCETSLVGMRPWYAGLVTRDNNGKCVIGEPVGGEEGLPAFVWTVILNVLYDMFAILGVVATGFIILGGYWYLRSGGDPTLVERGKKTLQAAIVGVVIALLSSLVTNFIITIIVNSSGGGS